MTAEPPDHDIKTLWQDQKTEISPMSVAEIRMRVSRVQTRARLSLAFVAIVAVAYVIFFGWQVASILPNWIGRLGGEIAIVGLLVILWSGSRSLPIRRPPDEAAAGALIEFHRAQLLKSRQKFGLLLLCAAPLLVGMTMVVASRHFEHPRGSLLDEVAPLLGIIGLWAVALWMMVRRRNRKIDRQLEELDRRS